MALNDDRGVCPYCPSERVVRNGCPKGRQVYRCKDCRRKHRYDKAVHGRHFPPELIGEAIPTYYRSRSLRGTAESIQKRYDIQHTDISPQTIARWVQTYTDVALNGMRGYQALTGKHWVICRLPLDFGSHAWWVVVDEDTGYILGSHVSRTRTAEGARAAIVEALASAARPCERVTYLECTITRGRMFGYISPMKVPEEINGELPRAIVVAPGEGPGSAPIVSDGGKFTYALLEARRKFNRIKNTEEIRRYVGGWVITYNLFGGQADELGRTPGQLAGVKPTFADWTDVVRKS